MNKENIQNLGDMLKKNRADVETELRKRGVDISQLDQSIVDRLIKETFFRDADQYAIDMVNKNKIKKYQQSYGGLLSAPWFIHYKFFQTPEMGKRVNHEEYNIYTSLMEQVANTTFFQLFAVVTKLPRRTYRDQEKRLHNNRGPAVKWNRELPGVEDRYFIHGVMFDKPLFTKIANRTITPEEILQIQNNDQKSMAISEIGYSFIDDMVKSGKARILDVGKKNTLKNGELIETENTLYEIDGLYGNNIKVKTVKCFDSSTGKMVFIDIPNERSRDGDAIDVSKLGSATLARQGDLLLLNLCKGAEKDIPRMKYTWDLTKANNCIAWTLQLRPEDYEKLIIEA